MDWEVAESGTVIRSSDAGILKNLYPSFPELSGDVRVLYSVGLYAARPVCAASFPTQKFSPIFATTTT
jgi:hypothetical protein